MKRLVFSAAALALLAGCATQQPGPPNYGTRGPVTYSSQPVDPHQWHTVSVTDVNLPPDAPRPANVTSEPMPLPAPAPAQPTVVYTTPAPVVVQPAPVIVEDPYYWYPPISLSLGFGWGHGWHHGGWGSVHYAPRGHWHR